MVPKKTTGDWRLVVDYRGMNAVTLHDAYELPLISDMLQKQSTKRMFGVLDMKKGCHQMPIPLNIRRCTAMSTQHGLN